MSAQDQDGSARPHITGTMVVAYGHLTMLPATQRIAALDELRRSDPELAATLERLLTHEPAPTRVLTGFAAETRDEARADASSSGASSAGPCHPRHHHAATSPRIHRGSIHIDSIHIDSIRINSIHGFTLHERIASGGMGEVWHARQLNPGRDVAIKIIPTAGGPAATQLSALHEPATLAALRHPSIATIHASGHEPGFTWIAMEFIDGARSITDAARTLALPARLRLMIDAVEAVVHAHAAGFLHRDLKPSNILVDPTGRVKVIDFGIALPRAEERLHSPLAWCGTPAYLAPEALLADPAHVDVRADVRALGVILFELVHGALPESLRGDNPLQVLRALRNERFASPHDRATHRDLTAIIARATAIDPVDRYRTAAALVDDLRAFLAHRPVDARPRGAVGRTMLAARRNPLAATLTALTFIALVSATAISASYALYARTAAIEAGALAEQTGASYVAFIEVFFPQGLDPSEAESMSIKEYLRRRVTRLEAQATSFRHQDMAGSFASVATIMQQACTTLGLPEEAERCMIVREIADARRPDPTGYITKTRHLDGLYTRLARDPSDAAARASLDTAVPGLLASQRIIRAGSLSLIGGVDYLRQPLVSEQVARALIEAEPGNPEVVHGAVSRLFYCVHHAVERADPLSDDHIRLLDLAVSHLERQAQSADPLAVDSMTGVANGIDLYLSANLAAAHDHRLIDAIVRVANLGDLGRWDPSVIGFGYTAAVPLRLIACGDYATAKALLERIDRLRLEPGVRVEAAQAIQLALARTELLMRTDSSLDRSQALTRAIAHLAEALGQDPLPSDRERTHEFHAHAMARLAELAAEQGDRALLDSLHARATRLREHARALDMPVRTGYLDDTVRHCEALRAAVPPSAPPRK